MFLKHVSYQPDSPATIAKVLDECIPDLYNVAPWDHVSEQLASTLHSHVQAKLHVKHQLVLYEPQPILYQQRWDEHHHQQLLQALSFDDDLDDTLNCTTTLTAALEAPADNFSDRAAAVAAAVAVTVAVAVAVAAVAVVVAVVITVAVAVAVAVAAAITAAEAATATAAPTEAPTPAPAPASASVSAAIITATVTVIVTVTVTAANYMHKRITCTSEPSYWISWLSARLSRRMCHAISSLWLHGLLVLWLRSCAKRDGVS
jgi:hypothetical protein